MLNCNMDDWQFDEELDDDEEDIWYDDYADEEE